MAPNLIVKTMFRLFLLFLACLFANGADEEWLRECERSVSNNQKECFLLGEVGARVSVQKSSIEMAERLFVFCHQGWRKEWYRLWINPRIKVIESEPNQEFQFIYGCNLTDVKSRHASSFLSLWNSWRMKEEYSLSPFNASCLGIVSNKAYTVDFKVKNPELWYIAFVAAGVIIFFSAKNWSRNVALHYSTGISLGVFASLLIVVFILNRLMPQKLKSLGYGILLLSGSASMFILQKVSTKFNDIMQNHWQLALGYVLVTGLISFAVVYRYGPVTDQKTLNLVRWSLQLSGLLLIYFGTQIPEASIAIIIVILTVYNFPRRILKGFSSLRYRFFRPKIRLLTEDEYIQQGQIETQNALDELRSFCRSPDCDSWRVVSRLKDPTRFAKFVEGNSHISDSEVLEHDSLTDFIPPHESSETEESETDFHLTSP